MNWSQMIINSILLGGVYAVVAVGFSLVWGVMNVINIAHGSTIMLGAFLTFAIYNGLGLDPYLTIPITMAVGFVIFFLFQRYLIGARMANIPIYMSLLIMFGVNLIISNVMILIWTANYRSIQPWYANKVLAIGESIIPVTRLVTFVLAIVVCLLLGVFMDRTKLGHAIRATRMDKEAASLMGINTDLIFSLSLGIGGAVAAGAGSLIGIIYPFSPTHGHPYLAIAFIVCTLGGLGSIQGALVGGLIFAAAQTLAVYVFGVTFQNFFTFSLLIAILLILPKGIIGREYYA